MSADLTIFSSSKWNFVITADDGINVGTLEIPIFDVPVRINGQIVAIVGFLPKTHHGAVYWKSIELNSKFWQWKDDILATAQKVFYKFD